MSDHQNEHQLHNEKFQRERIALFSDAVFAIAITLLVIEIQPPELHGGHTADSKLVNWLLGNMQRFFGFFVSFWVIGLYWMAHHRLFRFVVHSNSKLLTNNLLFLMPIVIMPFSTAFLTEFWLEDVHTPLVLYTTNIALSGLLSFRLWRIVASPKNKLSQGMDALVVEYNLTRALFTPSLFVILMILSFFNRWIVWVVPPLIPVFMHFVKRHYKKKYPQLWAYHNF